MKHHRRLYYIFKLITYLIFAILVFVFRETLVDHIDYFIGSLMLIYAFEEFLFEFLFHRKHFFHEGKIYLAFVEIILGILIFAVNLQYEHICVIWATWSIIRESYEIKEISNEA